MKIDWIGFYGGNTGYSGLSRVLVGLMDKAGIDVRPVELRGRLPKYFEKIGSKSPKGRMRILHQIPTVMPDADGYYVVTEFDQPTYGSISIMQKAKIILTESTFCKKIFAKYVDPDIIHVINYPLDPLFSPEGLKLKFDDKVEEFGFKFLSIFEWVMRKCPELLIEAFTEEFDKTEDVCLILRTWCRYKKLQKEITRLADDHNIFWLPDMVVDMPALYRACDAFVCPSAGEGWGHPFAEAMACGLPTIGPRSTGCLDYMNSNNAYLINVRKPEPMGDRKTAFPHLLKPWFKFSFPKKQSLKTQMRKVFEGDRTKVEEALKVREKFSFDKITEQLLEVFKD